MRRLLSLGFTLLMVGCGSSVAPSTPNIIIFLADDMGFGDLASYGHPTLRTPNIDRIAAQGVRLTSFVTAVGCVPSRTQLLTGRYMPRVAFNGSTGADGLGGLPDEELTLAEALKSAGYRTHIIGKWHLGYAEPKFLPVNQGFDTWFGLPYSNDYRKPWVQTDEPLALFRGTDIVEYPLHQDTLTARYTNEAVALIEGGGDEPFFIYLAYNMPHLPLHVGERFRGTAYSGLYGDVIQELDWSVGEVLDALRRSGLDSNTIVLFTSDNGPWINPPSRMLQAGIEPWHVGSAGLLRGSKGTSYEGGARVPAMLRWPDQIPPGWTSPELIAMPDIYRTLLAIAGVEAPSEHVLDGYDATQFLRGEVDQSPRREYFYFLERLEAVRVGDWKLRAVDGTVELFNLRLDPSEHVNRAEEKPEILGRLKARMTEMAKSVDYGLAF